ncbi:hypothetical protein H4582DRAFT_1097150 [Lactarius indigo]|nr:hypothetical protein H4582DRAFT_1097150 [Lactarius indigo]
MLTSQIDLLRAGKGLCLAVAKLLCVWSMTCSVPRLQYFFSWTKYALVMAFPFLPFSLNHLFEHPSFLTRVFTRRTTARHSIPPFVSTSNPPRADSYLRRLKYSLPFPIVQGPLQVVLNLFSLYTHTHRPTWCEHSQGPYHTHRQTARIPEFLLQALRPGFR